MDSMLSVSAENVDCFESGVICRKSLLITVGRSVIAFDDDSGKPVSTVYVSALCISGGLLNTFI